MDDLRMRDAASLPEDDDEAGIDLFDTLILLAENVKLLVLGPLLAGLIAFGITFVLKPVYTGKVTLLPPQQQQQGMLNSALASLGNLNGLAGGAAGIKSPLDQYVSLLQSNMVADHIIDQYKLFNVYNATLRADARAELARHVRINLGKKDGLISIEVDDQDRRRAADMANSHVEELRNLTKVIAVTEAQQRRMFFEKQLEDVKVKLTQAQQVLQASGFTEGALNAEPKTAAEGFARLKAQVTAAEVKLGVMRGYLNEDAPEYRQAQATLNELRAQLVKAEQAASSSHSGPDYISKYRDFKYQETLFDLLARQYEAARLDESREGTLIQVVDAATPPEKRSWPRRSPITLATVAVTALLLAVGLFIRRWWQQAGNEPETAEKLVRLKAVFRRA